MNFYPRYDPRAQAVRQRNAEIQAALKAEEKYRPARSVQRRSEPLSDMALKRKADRLLDEAEAIVNQLERRHPNRAVPTSPRPGERRRRPYETASLR